MKSLLMSVVLLFVAFSNAIAGQGFVHIDAKNGKFSVDAKEVIAMLNDWVSKNPTKRIIHFQIDRLIGSGQIGGVWILYEDKKPEEYLEQGKRPS